MLRVSRAALQKRPLSQILDEIATEATRVVRGADRASIILIEGREHRFRLAGSHGLSEHYKRLLSTGEAKLRPGQGPSGLAYVSGAPVVISDLDTDPATRLLGVAGHRPRGLLSGDRLAAVGACRHGRGDAQPVPHRSGRLARGAGPAAAVLRRARRRRCAHGPAAGRARQAGDGPASSGAGIARADPRARQPIARGQRPAGARRGRGGQGVPAGAEDNAHGGPRDAGHRTSRCRRWPAWCSPKRWRPPSARSR